MDDFRVYTVDETTGRIILSLPTLPQTVSGMEKLLQIVILALLNDPGRSAFYPEDGSGMPSLINSNIDPDDPTEILAEVSERVEKIKEEILESQGELENEDPSERLSDLLVLNVETGVNIDEVLLKLRLVSETGDEASLVI